MSEEIKVSIIVPVHNGEEYLSETLNGIVEQSFKAVEVILVDDGSTDNTATIIKEFQKNNPQILYKYQKSTNAGVARNFGFKYAKGEYVLFLDGDDLFEPTMVETMYNRMVETEADVCVCNADQYDTEQAVYIDRPQYLRKRYLPEKDPFSREDIGNAILYFTTSVPWNKMIKRDFLIENEIEFQDIERANDQYFSIMVLLMAKKITIVDQVLVHYRVQQKGNLTTEFSETPLCAYESMVKVESRLQETGLIQNPDVRQAFDNKVLNLMIYSLNIQNTLDGYRQLYDTITQGGLERIGVVLHDEPYYFNKLEYNNFCNMNQLSCDEFLFKKNREYRDTIARKNLQIKDVVNQKKEITLQLKQTEKELNDIKRKKWYQDIQRMVDRYHKIIKKN